MARSVGALGLKGPLGWGMILGAVVLALAFVGAGAAVGSPFLILLGMLGIPVILVGVGVVHYLNLAERAGGLGQAQERHFHAACERWAHMVTESIRRGRQAGVGDQALQRVVEGARHQLAGHAAVEADGDAVRVKPSGTVPGGGWIHRADLGVNALLQEVGRTVAPVLAQRLEALQEEFPEHASFKAEPLPDGTLLEVSEAYLSQVRRGSAYVTEQLEAMERAISDVEAEGLDVAEAWNHHRSARRLWQDGQVDLALKALESAQAIVHSHVKPEFDSRRAGLEGAAGMVRQLDLASLASPAVMERLQRLHNDIGRLQLAGGGLVALEKEERAFVQLLDDIARDCLQKADAARTAISGQGGFGDPEAAGDISEALRRIPAMTHPYQNAFPEWHETMRNVLPRLVASLGDAALDRWMPRLEGRIKDLLAKQGSVAPADLPVRERAQDILRRYARLHPAESEFRDGALRRRPEAP